MKLGSSIARFLKDHQEDPAPQIHALGYATGFPRLAEAEIWRKIRDALCEPFGCFQPKIGVGPQHGWFIMENPMNKWVFPKMMVPPNHPFVHRVLEPLFINHPFWVVNSPYLWFNPHFSSLFFVFFFHGKISCENLGRGSWGWWGRFCNATSYREINLCHLSSEQKPGYFRLDYTVHLYL